MTLSTHAVVGGASAALVGASPEVAIIIGLASHYILDSFPHWDYFTHLDISGGKNEITSKTFVWSLSLIKDALWIGLDCILGFGLLILFLPLSVKGLFLPALLGAVGGITPDFLQFIYFKYNFKPLKVMQKFHDYIHSEKRLHNFPKDYIPQAILIVIALIAINF